MSTDAAVAKAPTAVTGAAKAAVTRAAKEAVANAIADQAVPVIAETTALAVEVPSKVVLNQKVVFVVGIAGGMALGAGLLYGVAKFVEHRKIKKAVAVIETPQNEKNPKTA